MTSDALMCGLEWGRPVLWAHRTRLNQSLVVVTLRLSFLAACLTTSRNTAVYRHDFDNYVTISSFGTSLTQGRINTWPVGRVVHWSLSDTAAVASCAVLMPQRPHPLIARPPARRVMMHQTGGARRLIT